MTKWKVILKNKNTGKTMKYFTKAKNRTNAVLNIDERVDNTWELHDIVKR
jgi:hypothetical protein